VPDNEGNRPLAIAFLNKHSNMATMLIDNKANVSCQAKMIDRKKKLEEEEAKRKADKEAKE